MTEFKFALEAGFKVDFKQDNAGDFYAIWNEGKCVEYITAEEFAQFSTTVGVELTEEEIMKQWAESGDASFVANSVTTQDVKENIVADSTKVENDFSLLNSLGSQYKVGAVMRLQHFLRNTKIGKVTDYNLTLGNNGDIVGEVIGTEGSVLLRQYVYLTPTGKQAWRMKVIKG